MPAFKRKFPNDSNDDDEDLVLLNSRPVERADNDRQREGLAWPSAALARVSNAPVRVATSSASQKQGGVIDVLDSNGKLFIYPSASTCMPSRQLTVLYR